MSNILSRLLVGVAVLAASLAWGAFVFTHTVGDPGRGERIATAVLADDEARSEIVAPIASAVLATGAIPPEQQPLVAVQIDALLRDPATATTFIDPFAGSWARLLGEDDPRPAEFDLAPLLDELAAVFPELAGVIDEPSVADLVGPATDTTDEALGGVATDTVEPEEAERPVGDVPLPRTRLDWMSGFRSAADAAALPLAAFAAVAFAIAIAFGERARAMRRLGAWGVLAGGTWVIFPALAVWAARKWATSADATITIAIEEAVTGLRPVAVLLMMGGVAAFSASYFVPEPARRRSAPTEPAGAEPAEGPDARGRARPTAAGPGRSDGHEPPPRANPAGATPPHSTRPNVAPPTAPAPVFPQPGSVPPIPAPQRSVAPTAQMPAQPAAPTAPTPPVRDEAGPGERPAGDDPDAVWDYYS